MILQAKTWWNDLMETTQYPIRLYRYRKTNSSCLPHRFSSPLIITKYKKIIGIMLRIQTPYRTGHLQTRNICNILFAYIGWTQRIYLFKGSKFSLRCASCFRKLGCLWNYFCCYFWIITLNHRINRLNLVKSIRWILYLGAQRLKIS